MRMDQIRIETRDQTPQPQNGDRIWKGGLMALLPIHLRPRLPRPELFEAINLHTRVVFLFRKTWLVDRGHANLMAPLAQFSAKQLRLSVGSTDKWRIVITCNENSQAHSANLYCSLRRSVTW